MEQQRRGSMRKHSTVAEDEAQLAAMGHKPELERQFSLISMLGLAFAILNSWTALAASLSLALPSGGASSVLWGLVTAGICNLALAASLAEFLSAYPTAGGQYHWVAMISWESWVPSLSYICGWINVAGWIALTATGSLLGSELLMGALPLFHSDFTIKRWQEFVVYIGYTVIAFLINAYTSRLLHLINQTALIWSIAGFVIIAITVLACASPNFQSGSFVFGNFINTTGWPNGLAWLLGLLQGGFGVTGYDAVSHMIEEIPDPTIRGPIVMIGCVAIGLGTGFIFLMVLLFVVNDVDAAISSSMGPLLQIYLDATNSQAGSVCLLIFNLGCQLFATISIMTTSSRMTYAFARDRGLPFSPFFAKINVGLDVPMNSLILTTVLVIIFGCIYIGSTTAFNAIVSASVVALTITYAMPPIINCLRGRRMLPESRSFRLPGTFGWICNLIGIAYAILTTVLFLFPPAIPTTAEDMNYAVVALAIVAVVAIIYWVVDARKNFHGPQINEAQIVESGGEAPTATMNGTDVDANGVNGANGKVEEKVAE